MKNRRMMAREKAVIRRFLSFWHERRMYWIMGDFLRDIYRLRGGNGAHCQLPLRRGKPCGNEKSAAKESVSHVGMRYYHDACGTRERCCFCRYFRKSTVSGGRLRCRRGWPAWFQWFLCLRRKRSIVIEDVRQLQWCKTDEKEWKERIFIEKVGNILKERDKRGLNCKEIINFINY